MPYDNSDYYSYYNQKYELPKPTTICDLTSAKAVLEAYKEGIRIFKNITIKNESFANENLEGIIFKDSQLYADFRNTNLTNAEFSNGHIRTSDFRNANLTNARFEKLGVEKTQFEGAIMTDFVFQENTAFGNNNLTEADLEKFNYNFLGITTEEEVNLLVQENSFLYICYGIKTSHHYKMDKKL